MVPCYLSVLKILKWGGGVKQFIFCISDGKYVILYSYSMTKIERILN